MQILPSVMAPSVTAARALPFRAWIRLVATELALIILGAAVYLAVAASASGRTARAFAHARSLRAAEKALGLDLERSITIWWGADPLRTAVAGTFYVAAHFAVPIVILGLLVLVRPSAYRRYRTAFVATSMLGVAVSWLWPTAPPRLVEGFAAAPVISAAENPYAAFPSMHVGWAVWSALAISAITGRWWLRALGCLHVLVTGLAVLVTGQHWTLDLPGGALAAIAGLAIARSPRGVPPISILQEDVKQPEPSSSASG